MVRWRRGAALAAGAIVGIACAFELDPVKSAAVAGDGGPAALSEAGADGAPPDAGVDPASPYGTGRSGSLTVDAGVVIVNAYTPIVGAVRAGAVEIEVVSVAGFSVGGLVLAWQGTGLPIANPGDRAPVNLSATTVGVYELRRVASIQGMRITLSPPLTSDYASGASQVVSVPEYTDVSVGATGVLTGLAWDGASGGVVVFLATGAVRNEGAISVDALGSRGGVASKSPAGNACAALDGLPIDGYAAKGEGLFPGAFSPDGGVFGGMGNYANGGGGGDCHNAGGGGGGGAGAGGGGGRSGDGDRLVGGMGGVAIASAPARLWMGGGGGAGESNNGAPLPNGGAGGGAILIRARTIQGGGRISAAGVVGVGTPSLVDGAGGGGAGGSIVLTTDRVDGVVVRATGGGGGVCDNNHGPGGGGGGGRIHIYARAATALVFVDGGAPGTQGNAGAVDGPTFGAQAGASGVIERDAGP